MFVLMVAPTFPHQGFPVPWGPFDSEEDAQTFAEKNFSRKVTMVEELSPPF